VFPLNLYAHVRLLFVVARETAGAARTRSSPRPSWDRAAPSLEGRVRPLFLGAN
jgi:hypothetical protein